MNCREARLVLAALTHSLPAERRAEALAHVATLPVKERPQKSWRKPGRR